MLLVAAVVFSVQPSMGLSAGELDWNIASQLDTSITPNVVSELEFTTEAVHLGLTGRIESELFLKNTSFFLEINSNYGAVLDGESTDSDYFGDNRTGLYSRSVAEVSGDTLNLLEGGVGITTTLLSSLSLSFSLGGYHSEQQLNFQRGQQLVADPLFFFPVSTEELTANLRANLNSDYVTEWSGHWYGVKLGWQFEEWGISISAKKSDGDYYGEGRWSLRTEGVDALQQPKSFTHKAASQGEEFSIAVDYELTKKLSLQLKLMTTKRTTDAGLNVTYFANQTFGRSTFNGARWQSTSQWFGVTYSF